ncbi:sulfotransferase family protein [Sphingomonas flavalba]|uniref:sulfotransferase family protein n=1 Tax=Sphingomonas flavalba TaxID=2559804 RepID=UPI0039DFDA7D
MVVELDRALDGRLAMTDYIRRHPQILRERIVRPVFITGLYRSATTKLQNLMCADPYWQHVTTWQAGDPVPLADAPAGGEDPRIGVCHRRLAYMKQAAEQAFLAHPLAATDPSEEYALMTPSFRIVDAKQFGAGFLEWVRAQSMVPVYRDLHRALQLLQYQFKRQDLPEQRFCLKAPIHLGNLDALLEVFPDAKILVTHRDPFPAIHSYTMLRESLRGMVVDQVDPQALGDEILERSAQALDAFVRVRRRHPEHFLDLGFRSVVHHGADLIDTIYRFVDAPVSSEARAAFRAEDNRKDTHKSGALRQDPARYGLDPGRVNARVRGYLDWADRHVDG